ncbi:MAG: PD-(D/E)XK nuclease domain-containing protein, partial [Microscillaceae bacterium]|nr:PD-(D/E)XK nuclease domain-containing protein [Microscillaceae bacterium]
GYTQEELETYFGERIDEMSPDFGGREALLTKIKQWYNGYSWDTKNFVYNPFSILGFFDKRSFENFWFETGTPTFLLKTLNREKQYNLDNIRSTALTFGSFELGNITPEALLFQTGYLTLKAVDKRGVYTLSYPNLEVKDSLLQYLLAEYSHESLTYVSPRVVTMLEALEAHQVDEFVNTLNSLFASIPYQIFIAHVEAYYHSVTFLALSLMGSFVQVEASQAKGRPDAVVHTDDCIYVMEFKLDENAEAAMQQIKERGYTKPYLHLGKPVKAVGINFNSSKKEVDQWLEEKV